MALKTFALDLSTLSPSLQSTWDILCSKFVGNGNMMWGWSAFLFFLNLYLLEGSPQSQKFWFGRFKLGHMMTLVLQSHLHIVFQTEIISLLDIYSPGVVCCRIYR